MPEVRDLYAKIDRMTDTEVAKAIANAGSYESQFLILEYLSKNDRRGNVGRILNEDNWFHGSLLE